MTELTETGRMMVYLDTNTTMWVVVYRSCLLIVFTSSVKSETRSSVGVNRAKEVGRFPVHRPGTYVTVRQH